MKLALNGATTMYADLETDIKAAAEAGFDYVEIWAAKLRAFLKDKTVEDLSQLLNKNNIRAYSLNSIENTVFRNAADYAEIKQTCKELSEIANAINCPYIVVIPGKLPQNANEEFIIDESVKVLTELAGIAAKHNIGLAFEFLGQTDCSVQTLDLAKVIIEKVDLPNVGLVIDTFHFYAGNSTLEAIENLNAKDLFVFHINDAEDLPKEQLTDAHRLYPGLGILPIAEIKARLDKIGYDEVTSVEIFRPEYWADNPSDVAKKSFDATRKVLNLN